MTVFAKFRSFDPAARLLMVNQFGINLGFYMLMPYLAGYLSGPMGLAAWAVGLVLGVRNFSQQGMFLLGGTLADRLGYKPLIVAGCLLRTGGFALLVWAHSLPGLLIASAATGFAGALFNPAVRAYLAADAGSAAWRRSRSSTSSIRRAYSPAHWSDSRCWRWISESRRGRPQWCSPR